METKYRIRKVVFMLAFIAILLVCANVARADYVDLKGGDVLAQATCEKDGKQFLCVVVTSKGKTYMVLIDQKGEHSIYQSIKDKAVLIWSRKSL